MKYPLPLLIIALLFAGISVNAQKQQYFKFNFGNTAGPIEYLPVASNCNYTDTRGYGFSNNSEVNVPFSQKSSLVRCCNLSDN